MAPERAPAFQFYPKDFLTDGNVAGMSLQERGAYISLICLCWLERSLPDDIGRLANLVGVPRQAMVRLWPALARCFRASPDDPTRLIHPRLETERKKQDEFRHRQSDAGRLSASKRKATTRQPDIQPDINHGSTKSLPESNSPISYLRTPVKNIQILSPPISGTTDPALAERAGRFCERYAELYPLHRCGARYLPKPALDYVKACELCAIWDSPRLERLAIVFLKCEEPFAQSGSRTIGQFAAMASWADARLAEAEAGA